MFLLLNDTTQHVELALLLECLGLASASFGEPTTTARHCSARERHVDPVRVEDE